jgi:type I restriction enzyme S subunit
VQPGPHIPDGVPYVRACDIQDGTILTDQLLRTSRQIAKRYERASLQGGDVLLGIIRATKVVVVPEKLAGSNITQGTARFRPSTAIQTHYLAGWLESPFAQAWLHAHYRGIDMPGLNLRDVRRLPVPLAPLREQEAIAEVIAAGMSKLRLLSELTGQVVHELGHLDQAILAKAFRREVVPQDPNDEPASVLLERIRAERAGMTRPRSRRR